MPKSRRAEVTEKYKKCIGKPAVMHKCRKLAVLLSQNDTKNSISRRSAVKEKCQKLEVIGHKKMPKSHRSAATKKCQKLAGLQSWKNTKLHKLVVME